VSSSLVDADDPSGVPAEPAQVDILDTTDAGPSIIRGSLLRLGSQVAGILVTVGASAVIIRHLGVVNTGRFVTVTALVTIVAGVSDLGLTGIALREYAIKPRQEGREFLSNLLGMRLAVATLALTIAVAFAAVVNYTPAMVVGTFIAGLGMVLMIVQQSLSIPMQVELRLGWVAGLQLAFQVAIAVEAVVLALVGAGLLPFFATQAPAALVVLGLTAVVGGRNARLRPRFQLAELRRMLTRIVTYSAAVVLAVLYFRIAQVMVSVLSSGTQTGYFGVSFRVLDTVTTLPSLLAVSALPVLARSARDDMTRFAYASRRLGETMIVAGIGVALTLFLGARFAVDVVAGAGFGPAVHVLRVLAFALLGTFVLMARGYALLALDRLRAMMVSNGVAFVVVLAAGIPLISAHGAIGAAIALVAAELSLAVCYELSLSRTQSDLRISSSFALRAAGAAVATGALVTALALPAVVAAILGAAIYGVALIVLRVLPPEIFHALSPRSWMAGRRP
jgi:O-antigen/teichoic acid export membrane protein